MTAHRTIQRVTALLAPVAARFERRLGPGNDTRTRIMTAGRLAGMGTLHLLLLKLLTVLNPERALTCVMIHLNRVVGLSAFEDQELFETNGF